MDKRAKEDILEILESFANNPTLINEAIISIEDVLDSYRRRTFKLSEERRKIEKELRNEQI